MILIYYFFYGHVKLFDFYHFWLYGGRCDHLMIRFYIWWCLWWYDRVISVRITLISVVIHGAGEKIPVSPT